MDLVLSLGIITGLYFGALYVNKLVTKIDEHEDVTKSED
jgi:hypothetical protein